MYLAVSGCLIIRLEAKRSPVSSNLQKQAGLRPFAAPSVIVAAGYTTGGITTPKHYRAVVRQDFGMTILIKNRHLADQQQES